MNAHRIHAGGKGVNVRGRRIERSVNHADEFILKIIGQIFYSADLLGCRNAFDVNIAAADSYRAVKTGVAGKGGGRNVIENISAR